MKKSYIKKNNINLELYITGVVAFVSAFLSFLWIGQILSSEVTFARQCIHILFIFSFFSSYGVYIAGRYGYLQRLRTHRPASEKKLASLWENPRTLTFLLPSYKEEISVIRQSLLSSALQLYPDKKIVLLIDDPPSEDPALKETKELVQSIDNLLKVPLKKMKKAYRTWIEQGDDAASHLREAHKQAACWFLSQADRYPITDHAEKAFVELTFLQRARYHQKQARRKTFDTKSEWKKLLTCFQAEVTFFERKQFENLSHAANKAMNLNSYITLMGKRFSIRHNGSKAHLEENLHGEIFIPETEFVAMLDADSILSFDYAIRLVYQLSLPQMDNVAVIQTPYSAFPGARGELERIAGATTDMQYIVHQGFTYFNATFWVGANAIARKTALDAIMERGEERGYPICRYIQDRTVIEDTESSVDLVDLGWTLYNYPERLSYSATPPDFGSLLIQRRRWANGGLLILPKLLFYHFRKGISGFFEAIMRMHYLGSIGFTLAALLLLIFSPFTPDELGMISLLSPIPYLFLYGRDLVLTGYRSTDLLRVMALNILLLPVNGAGVAKSIEQAWTGEQIPFCRTPKVKGKTLVPTFYHILEWLLGGCVAFIAVWTAMVFPLVIAIPHILVTVLTGYALLQYLIDFKDYNAQGLKDAQSATQLRLSV